MDKHTQHIQHIQSKSDSDSRKYDIVFIGGGPSTLSFISYLFQYRHAQKVFTSTKILILEKTDNFGSGFLGGYGINTNTDAQGFSRLICDPNSFINSQEASLLNNEQKQEKQEKEEIENEFDDPDYETEKVYQPLPGFKEIFECAPTQTLIKIGIKCAPLGLVGYYLDCVGNYFVDLIYRKFNQNILMNNVEVQSIKLNKNDEFGIYLKSTDPKNDKKVFQIKAKHVVLANGGRPKIPSNITQILKILKDPSDFYFSNNILQEYGYRSLIENLSKKESKTKKIVIIGGSHSGFSSTWILLNRPSTYKHLLIGSDYQVKRKINCEVCSTNTFKNKQCTCYGEVYNKIWSFNPDNKGESKEDSEIFQKANEFELDITILYKDQIRVFYKTEMDAYKDGYNQFNTKTDMNQKGKIFPFVGLRADAKQLYLNIIRGKEKRVKLVKTTNFEDQAKYIADSDATIWACGYETENIEAFDFRDIPIAFCKGPDSLLEIDAKQRLMTKNKMPLKNFFGIGQGYSTFAKEVINGVKARGDSVHLYNTLTSKRLYKSLEEFFFKQIYEAGRKQVVQKVPVIQSKSLKVNINVGNTMTTSNGINIGNGVNGKVNEKYEKQKSNDDKEKEKNTNSNYQFSNDYYTDLLKENLANNYYSNDPSKDIKIQIADKLDNSNHNSNNSNQHNSINHNNNINQTNQSNQTKLKQTNTVNNIGTKVKKTFK